MMLCRFCGEEAKEILDLGYMPPSNSFLSNLNSPEVYYPLRLYVCPACWLVQIEETKKASEIFTEDYVYYSSESPSNVSHAKEYSDMMMKRFNPKTVLEIGSNDGYMLQWFFWRGCQVQGIDPAEGPARIAETKGIPTDRWFFGADNLTRPCLQHYKGRFDLICGINVLNHQPDINDFVKGLKIALAPKGVITFEFPHLIQMIEKCQFDTIYHEHLEYYSLSVIDNIFRLHGLDIFDVDELPEHGGSLRIYAKHSEGTLHLSDKFVEIIGWECDYGLMNMSYYQDFSKSVENLRYGFRKFIYKEVALGKRIVAYGAAAKANTLLNYYGMHKDVIEFISDRSPHKQGKFLPGSHIPVRSEKSILLARPDYVLITAWNLKDEIMEQLSYIRDWGGKFIIPIPILEVL